MPLTAFLIALIRGQLATSDARKLAAKYGISVDHAAGYLKMHRGW